MHDNLGCKAKRLENELKHDIEIWSEVWGCDCTLKFENYAFEIVEPQKHIGVKKGRKSGGFIILMKKYLNNKLVKFVKKSNNFIWIEISKNVIENLEDNFFVVASYINDVTSTYYDDEIFEELNKDMLTFCNDSTPVLLMGDLNSRTGVQNEIYTECDNDFLPNFPQKTKFCDVPPRKNCDKKEDSHGKKIITFCKTFDFMILNGRTKGDLCGNYTHLNFNNGPSTVDYGLCNEKSYAFIDNFLVLPMNELSDHSKIVTIFKDNPSINSNNESDHYNWKSRGVLYQWDKRSKSNFFNELKTNTKEIEEITQRIDAGLIHGTGEKIQQLFINTAKATLKTKTKKISKNWKKRNKSKKWFDDDCKKLKTEVRKFGKEKHLSPHDNLLRLTYHEKLREFKKTCKSKKYFFLQDSLNEIESALDDSKSFWEKWKNFGEIDTKKTCTKIPGDKLYTHYSSLHNETCDDQVPGLEPVSNKITDNEKLNRPFSKTEFKNVIENLKGNKSEGYDCISNEMIKNSPDIVFNLIYRFMNLCLEKSLIPDSWARELITLIHKKGDEFDLGNYRGICVSSALLKVLCTLLNNRVQGLCLENGLISKNQIGFQKNCRTSDHIFTLKTLVKKYVTIGKQKLYVCFIDFEKAFDSVWHKGLFHKLHNNGIIGKSLNLIFHLYNKTRCAVKMKDGITEFFDYTKGVRQGCPLSPLLFNLYVNDLIDTINKNSTTDVYLNANNKINALMYADDLVLISETKEGLQRQIDSLHEYCKKWKLSINIKKTKTMIFNRGNKLIKSDFNVGSSPIENVKTFTYLGFTISAKNCQFQSTIDDLSIKANRAIFAIKSKIKLSKLPIRLAIKIFNSQIMPILLYGSEIWGPYMDYNFDTWDSTKIERIHTQFLKQVLGCNIQTSNNMIRADTGCRPLITHLIKRFILYAKNVQQRTSNLCYDALVYETKNSESPNFIKFIEKFNLNIEDMVQKSKAGLSKICHGTYDRFWGESISVSPKAISFNKYKTNIILESYLAQKFNIKHKIAISRFRLSNHQLMIEKGRHMKPKIERNERLCYLCKNEIENEEHFLVSCPLYSPQRKVLEKACVENCNRYDYLSKEQKFIFIMSNENEDILKTLGNFIFNSMILREKIIEYFFI